MNKNKLWCWQHSWKQHNKYHRLCCTKHVLAYTRIIETLNDEGFKGHWEAINESQSLSYPTMTDNKNNNKSTVNNKCIFLLHNKQPVAQCPSITVSSFGCDGLGNLLTNFWHQVIKTQLPDSESKILLTQVDVNDNNHATVHNFIMIS